MHGQSATSEAIVPATVSRTQPRRRFYVGAALFVIFVNVVGFGPSIVDQSRRNASPSPLVAAHGLVTAAWLFLFLAQALLVATRHTAVHRQLGRGAGFLTVAMVGIGSLTVIEMTRRGHDLSGDLARIGIAFGAPPTPTRDELVGEMFNPLLAFFNFGALVAAGLWFRHRAEIHKRLMQLAMVSLVATPLLHLSGYLIGHWPNFNRLVPIALPVVGNLLLFTGAVYDKVSRGRIHPISLWIPILLIVEIFGLRALVTPSTAWRAIGNWLVG